MKLSQRSSDVSLARSDVVYLHRWLQWAALRMELQILQAAALLSGWYSSRH